MAIATALATVCVGQVPASAASDGTVAIHIKNGYGYEVKPIEAKVTITNASGADFSPSDFNGTVRLPLGRYILKVHVMGFENWTGELLVSRPLTRLTIGMPIGGIDGPKPTCALSGQVVGPGATGAWVRLMPLYADKALEVDVSPEGHFQLDGAECGDYILAVVSGDKVLRSVYIRLKHEPNTISVPLGPQQ